MSTNYPGALDSHSTKVDGVDDVMAADINNPQDAIEALEAQHQTRSLLKRKNSSGGTLVGGQLGYIDEAGDFKITTTANLNATWAVVIVGGANNAQIIVCRRGRVTVILNANCSIGDFLLTSTVAGRANVSSTMRPEIFAVALTANTGGAGGTCEALLLTGTATVSLSSAFVVYRGNLSGDSDWQGTIATLPGGAVLTYNIVGGDERVLQSAFGTDIAKLTLYNITRGDNALILQTVIATNTVTLTAGVPGTWQVGDSIDVRSQTNTNVSGTSYFFDYQITSVIPILARSMGVEVTWTDSGGTGERLILHSFVAFANGKRMILDTVVAGGSLFGYKNIPLIDRKYTAQWTASGAATASHILVLTDAKVAVP